MKHWSPTSWADYPYLQAVDYQHPNSLHDVVATLSQMPPLVSHTDIDRLKNQIAQAGEGRALILQGGDCAESFADCRADVVANKLKIMLQMSEILAQGLQKPVIQVGRIAGQYAKPRSSEYESINDITLPSYRGDLINKPEFSLQARQAKAEYLLQGYHCAAKTLQFIQDLFKGDFYTSHEALHLFYEQALTRHTNGQWYDLSTHFPWVGMRTAQPEGAHLHFLSGIANPVAIKIGPKVSRSELIKMITLLNPHAEAGKLTLITRLGEEHMAYVLPELIEAVQKTDIPVTWSCDPMHGNTKTTDDGIKTRYFDTILSELTQAMHIHQRYGSHLGGVHFELSADDVTECIGGAGTITPPDLKKAYHSLVDPRLNYQQSLEMARQITKYAQKMRQSSSASTFAAHIKSL